MENKVNTQGNKRGISRRKLLKSAGGVGVALAGGTALSTIIGCEKSPSVSSKRTVHVLAWNHFIKESDAWVKGEFATEFEKATGNKLKYESINANDIPARATAAVESGTGPDVFQLQWNQAHLYANGLEDHDSLGSDLGVDGFYSYLKESATVEGTLRGVPFYGVGNGNAYRKDIFAKLGITKTPDTWEEYLTIGAKLKKNGTPVGQTLGHTFGDAPTFTYPLLWSFGGKEVDEDGKVAINSKETLTACEYLKEFWNSACDENGLAWDDSSNNRAFFAETIGSTLNGASIYFVAKNNPEKAPPGLADKIGHFMNPKGPAGQYHTILPFHHSIASYSKNKEAATEYIKFAMEKGNYEKFITTQEGYGLGATPDWENHSMWKDLPAVEPFRLNAKFGRNMGYAGAYNRKASEVQAKYIITDLFARVAKGDSPQSAIEQTERELKNVYGG